MVVASHGSIPAVEVLDAFTPVIMVAMEYPFRGGEGAKYPVCCVAFGGDGAMVTVAKLPPIHTGMDVLLWGMNPFPFSYQPPSPVPCCIRTWRYCTG